MNDFVAWGNYTALLLAKPPFEDGQPHEPALWTSRFRHDNWLAGACGQQYLLGARVEILDSENP